MLPDRLLADVVWPQVRDLWNRKEAWAGCSELDEDLQNGWDQAKQCLTVLRQLEQNGILTIQHLKNTQDSWTGLSALRRRNCEILEKEYRTLRFLNGYARQEYSQPRRFGRKDSRQQ